MKAEFWIPTIISLASIVWSYLQSRKIVSLQSDAERRNLVHKYQFEKEFQIYQELWSDLIELRNTTLSLRPVASFTESPGNDDAAKGEKMRLLSVAFSRVKVSFEKNRPFYSESIYKEVHDLAKLAWLEAVQARNLDDKTDEYWTSADTNSKKILASIEKICNLIRARIQNK